MTDRPTENFKIENGLLISTNPVTGAEVGRFPVTDALELGRAVDRARSASRWWTQLGFARRRAILLRFAARVAGTAEELADLIHAETGKPRADALLEIVGGVEHAAWAARNARRVLRPRRVRTFPQQLEFAARVEYHPYGVVGVIGPWNYPVLTPLGAICGALAAGNAVIFKPSEHSPAIGARLGELLAGVLADQAGHQPVLQVAPGAGETGAALCRSGVDKVAFTGSTRTAKRVMAACAETLTPVVLECGGKDAAIVAADADLAAAAEACVWGGLANAGQTCVGLERVYVAEAVYETFLELLVERAGRLTVGPAADDDLGPITTRAQLATIQRHIEDALARGGRAVLGGTGAVQPPYVWPTILTDLPEDALAVREETFGPTLVVRPVSDQAEALRLANASRYGLGCAVFSRSAGPADGGRVRSGMASVNSALAFCGIPGLPFGGVGDSGFGRVHGAEGLREFAWPQSIVTRRFRSPVPLLTFDRPAYAVRLIERLLRRRARGDR